MCDKFMTGSLFNKSERLGTVVQVGALIIFRARVITKMPNHGALFGLVDGAGVPCAGALPSLQHPWLLILALGPLLLVTPLSLDLFPVMSSTVLSIKPKGQKKYRAMAAILPFTITEFCILHHISWTKHDNAKRVTSTPMFWWSRITMILKQVA